MKAITHFQKESYSPVLESFNVAGNNYQRIQSIVEQYANFKGYKFTYTHYSSEYNPEYKNLMNKKGLSYIK
tara:strand:+ start:933 stop:1145 length:213 start_codon:yes stop_codon:yes gene_type:complete